MLRINKIGEILDHYGKKAQKLKALEELVELMEVVLNDINKDNAYGITGEIADVHIMLTQLELIYDVDPAELREMIDYKLDRQLERIAREVG